LSFPLTYSLKLATVLKQTTNLFSLVVSVACEKWG